jgi:hypothetical protein
LILGIAVARSSTVEIWPARVCRAIGASLEIDLVMEPKVG